MKMNPENPTFKPLHPGEVLLEEYLKPLDISQNKLALSMRVPSQRISEIVNRRRAITAETALRLSIVTGTTPEFWMALQADYDLQIEQRRHGDKIENEVLPLNALSIADESKTEYE
jgi:addiction module HigA family antidote